ncbi:MAG TPA: arginine--tRNA ligase, partial [Candidatus Methylacidiphilales bacterium]|nr:arginine--tRNA ligase [Candidatus Methylacidiphilales bacterium]
PPPAPHVRPCLDARHGDFQTNAALVQAKLAQRNPRELAEELRAALDLEGIAEPAEIAGPGFLNFRLTNAYVEQQVAARWDDRRLGVPTVARPEKIVVDYSSPNIAKEMHVGHLRSTILGDALARIHVFLGHEVIADNHIGDWGTSFGMILLGYKREGNAEKLELDPFGHLESIYQKIQAEAKTDESIREAARRELVMLQQGDGENRKLWEQFRNYSLDALDVIYQKLGVQFDHTLGESFYNNALPHVVNDLVKQGIARESEGAIAIFSDGSLPPKEDPFLVSEGGEFRDNPFLIRKSDGGFNYATTDLATVQYRHEHFRAHRVLYVVGGPQQMHFRQLFAAARRWGFDDMKLEHVWFGTILGPDKKPFKSREGTSVKFRALLAEAEERAAKILAEKMAAQQAKLEERGEGAAERRPGLSDHQKAILARVVGLGALKYADLAQNRNLDYVFSWDKLLAFDGNTAPYLQNAYVRARAIFRKAGLDGAPDAAVVLADPAELALGRKLLDFADSLLIAAEEYRPHYLCLYLFELATLFHKFYELCPVLGAAPEVRDSRLILADLTARTLGLGLNLLGIEVVEQM